MNTFRALKIVHINVRKEVKAKIGHEMRCKVRVTGVCMYNSQIGVEMTLVRAPIPTILQQRGRTFTAFEVLICNET